MSTSVSRRSLFAYDAALSQEDGPFLGIDEAGRGALAGPVVAGAVILDLSDPIEGLDDSKKLTSVKRDALYAQIVTRAIAWAAGMASHEEIEKHNILNATFLAMNRAIAQIQSSWNVALVDGNQLIRDFPLDKKQQTIIQGDGTSASIAAASIVAKVTRDRHMADLESEHPGYGFADHKGYGTEIHTSAIRMLGLSTVHRRQFCEGILVEQLSLF